MGQKGSRWVSAVAPTSAEEAQKGVDLGERVSLEAHNAAVIGAGVAGVHVAYELANMGFKVTVFERRDDIAGGETQYSLPFVGVGLVEPTLARATLRSEILRSVLFPAACPDLIAREHLFHTVLNPVMYRWMWGRLCSCFSDQEVLQYTNNLSRVSHTVVRDLVNKYPQLQKHVFAGPVTVLNEKKETAATAHSEPFMVDPVGWTRAMANICRSQLGVEFALGVRLEDTNTYLKYDVESMKSIRVSKLDPLNPNQRVFANEMYDVVVLAAGSSTGTITLPNSRLPILGLSGLSAVVQQPAGELKDALWSLFQRRPPAPRRGADADVSSIADPTTTAVAAAGAASSRSRPAPGTLALLSSKCSLYAYTWPGATTANADACGATSLVQSKVMPTAQDYVVQGLLSLDSTFKSRSDSIVTQQLERLESYIRIKCGATVPLCSSTPAEADKTCAHADGDNNSSHTSCTKHNNIHMSEYVRAFTPDGVPLVDHNGGAFNCFVCSGFGDHAMDFAPGAAKVLGKLVEHQAQRLREEDIENVKTWGVLASKLTPSRRAEVESELQALFNGVVPREANEGKDGSLSAATLAADLTAAPQEPTLKFEMNPFSTNRFTGLVRKEVKNVTTPSWLEQLYAFEDRLQARIEPYRVGLHHRMMDFAERDNVPDALRTIIFCYFYDESDDPDAVSRKLALRDEIRQLAEKYEAPASTQDGVAGLTPAERSQRKQAEAERQTRELFSKP
ncbi:putative mitochondrial hypothetical protein [Leptomonas pyrrhocoris]|uniref:FAD-dependent oxidoreductase domain-containing protein 1 n=1 Tax=Leptomonas pyrrhocoris TaxID=157538 RepID=A0A0M9G3Z4_LEPPY|nr:putative mitochondrial hypothetical protein [Leptomonas pyrrhocoris]KPA81679.1 putative mitochondrial hypothetical protein [Leptomonas pyrrhocoris]|eukprot:XP_015660118.1 putative mitochondrial hypothetical protein [Leptomonas pyrrhocoris]